VDAPLAASQFVKQPTMLQQQAALTLIFGAFSYRLHQWLQRRAMYATLFWQQLQQQQQQQ